MCFVTKLSDGKHFPSYINQYLNGSQKNLLLRDLYNLYFPRLYLRFYSMNIVKKYFFANKLFWGYL